MSCPATHHPFLTYRNSWNRAGKTWSRHRTAFSRAASRETDIALVLAQRNGLEILYWGRLFGSQNLAGRVFAQSAAMSEEPPYGIPEAEKQRLVADSIGPIGRRG
ncbi:hypothetical protein GCM10022233_04430 [Streptomyces shaanxiensis]|uniref:Tn3 transposase DDE domain-containing protein n=1 Tax=Streptomyces shaanxiensis TaxID=653357 RepID=A0ABP7UAI4_9ACTN